ncbi:MAG: hypothetical protein ACR2PW_02535 [Gammaproteobacteria bacterium]
MKESELREPAEAQLAISPADSVVYLYLSWLVPTVTATVLALMLLHVHPILSLVAIALTGWYGLHQWRWSKGRLELLASGRWRYLKWHKGRFQWASVCQVMAFNSHLLWTSIQLALVIDAAVKPRTDKIWLVFLPDVFAPTIRRQGIRQLQLALQNPVPGDGH